MLSELGLIGWTGALHVGGRPGGVLHLVGGRISYAETPACPGLGQRLVASGRLSPEAWSSALTEGRAGCRVGRVLMRDGVIGQNELASRVVAAVADAVGELLMAGPAPVRLVADERHWLGEIGPRRRRCAFRRP